MVKKRQKKGEKGLGGRGVLIFVLILAGALILAGGGKEQQEAPPQPPPQEQKLVLGLYPVLDLPPASEPGKVKIVEFLSFYCDNCYRFNTIKHQLEQKYGDALELELVPIVWGEQSIKTVEAYIIAERMGRGREMADAMFRARFEEGRDIGDVEVLVELARGIGLGEEFERQLRGGAAQAEAQENIRLAVSYGVEETPTLIVNGNIVVNPHPTGDDVVAMARNLETIIQGLLG
ncbi:MAG: thioredoxin domain-containing protein [Euryarchaeota archaeon]|nr:thioredoxin domain-containing protein [Euryarchaeota archaeon]